MKKKAIIKLVVGVVCIGGSMGYFVYHAMQSSWSYYYSVDEFTDRGSSAQNSSFRVAGRVSKGSVERDLQHLAFKLAGSKTALPVRYEGVVPDNFSEDIEVVVEGHLATTGVFQASKLMTKCDSKYRAKIK